MTPDIISKKGTSGVQSAAENITLANAVYDVLRTDILAAALAPGIKLRMDYVCKRYGVGSSPMREALTRLASEGFVTRKENRGFYVAEVSAEDLRQLSETRCWIEDIAIRKAIERGDHSWEEGIVVSFHRMSRTPRPPAGTVYRPDTEWVLLHNAFHDALIGACGSRWLLDFCRHLRDQAYRYRRVTSEERARVSVKEHEAIMKATLARDPDMASALLSAHYRKTAELTLRRILAKPRRAGDMANDAQD